MKLLRFLTPLFLMFFSLQSFSQNLLQDKIHSAESNSKEPIERSIIERRSQLISLNRLHSQAEYELASALDVDTSCLTGPLPSTPTSAPISLTAFYFNDEFKMEFWREPCTNGSGKSAVLFRATPISGTPFLCGPGFSALQNGTQFDSIKLQTSIESTSFCDDLLSPQTFILNQWSILDNFDDQQEFDLTFDGYLAHYTTTIPENSGSAAAFPLTAYNIPSTQSPDKVYLHFINRGTSSAHIEGTLIHEDGHTLGIGKTTIIDSISPDQRVILNAGDIERIFGTTVWTKRSRLEALSSSPNIDLLAVVRTENGTTTNLTCVNEQYAQNIPKSTGFDKAFIRISNTKDAPIEVRGSLYHQNGTALGQEDSVIFDNLPAKATRVITADQLETIFSAEIWDGRARLEITSELGDVVLMNLIRSSGTLTNMSCTSSSRAPNIPSLASGDKAFIRITNTSDASVSINGNLHHQDGDLLNTNLTKLTTHIGQKETQVFSASDFENLLGVTTWDKRSRLEILGDTSRFLLMNLIRSPSGILTNMSCANSGTAYYIPNSSATDKAFVRITNSADQSVNIFGNLYGESGQLIGQSDFPIASNVAPNQTIVLDGSQLRTLSGGSEWQGLARLEISYPINRIEVLNLLRNENGTLTNLSCSAKRFGVYSVSGNISIKNGFIQDSDINNTDTDPVSNNDFSSAQELDNPFTIQGYANEPESGEQGNLFDSGDEWDVYFGSFTTGQYLNLEVAESETEADLDLYLFDLNGNAVDASTSTNKFESLSIPESGSYYVAVNAYAGASNYTVWSSSQQTSTNLSTLKLSDNFVPGDIIVKSSGPVSNRVSSSSKADLLQARLLQAGATKKATAGNALSLYNLGDNASTIASSATRLRAARTMSSATMNNLTIQMSKNQKEKLETLLAIKEISKRSDVQFAEPNYIHEALSLPNDPSYSKQWHFPLINLPSAWNISTGSSNVVVAVIDTGILPNHPDLQGKLVNGYDFISNPYSSGDGDGIDSDPADPGDDPQYGSSFHGTHVAGIVGAQSNNSIGVAGVAWHTSIMPIRVLGLGRTGSNWDIQQGVLYAAGLPNASGTTPSQRADIINLSLGGSSPSQSAAETYAQARQAGVIIVAAAGNTPNNLPNYPASYPGVVSVSAVDIEKRLSHFSSYGTNIDLAAPGGDTRRDLNGDGITDGIFSTLGNDSSGSLVLTYGTQQGTSQAAPHVAGVAALMKAVYPQLTPAEFDQLLVSGQLTQDLGATGRDDFFGYGLIDAYKAVSAALELANGGVIQLPPQLTSSITSIAFGASLQSIELELTNSGDGTLNVYNLYPETGSWLNYEPVNVDSSGLGRYRLSVNRSTLSSGIFTTNFVIQSTAGQIEIPVTVVVTSQNLIPNAGLHYVLLLDAFSLETVESVLVEANNGEYHYRFDGVTGGKYYVLAGTDADNDYYICDAGEVCGGFPLRNAMTPIKVDRDLNYINFTTGTNNITPLNAGSSAMEQRKNRGAALRSAN